MSFCTRQVAWSWNFGKWKFFLLQKPLWNILQTPALFGNTKLWKLNVHCKDYCLYKYKGKTREGSWNCLSKRCFVIMEHSPIMQICQTAMCRCGYYKWIISNNGTITWICCWRWLPINPSTGGLYLMLNFYDCVFGAQVLQDISLMLVGCGGCIVMAYYKCKYSDYSNAIDIGRRWKLFVWEKQDYFESCFPGTIYTWKVMCCSGETEKWIVLRILRLGNNTVNCRTMTIVF